MDEEICFVVFYIVMLFVIDGSDDVDDDVFNIVFDSIDGEEEGIELLFSIIFWR